jgi:hypothetical protein
LTLHGDDEELGGQSSRFDQSNGHDGISEYNQSQSPLLGDDHAELNRSGDLDESRSSFLDSNGDFVTSFDNLNALEVAAVTNAKRFLAQRVVQRVIESIWKGDIVFWETLELGSEKGAYIYNKKKSDPYCRLRVPRYLKAFEALFLVSFVFVYLAVLVPVQRNSSHRARRPGVPPLTTNDPDVPLNTPIHNFHHVTAPEVLLYVWIIAFAYDEFGEYSKYGAHKSFQIHVFFDSCARLCMSRCFRAGLRMIPFI